MIAFAEAIGQGFTLPYAIIDSAYYEIRLGRSCDSVRREQAENIRISGEQLTAQGEAIKLQDGKIQALETLVNNSRKETALVKQESKENERRLKKRIVTLGKVSLIEGLVILGLLIL